MARKATPKPKPAYLQSKYAIDAAVRSFGLAVLAMDDPQYEIGLRLRAAQEVMDRVWGRPHQAVAVNLQTDAHRDGPHTIPIVPAAAEPLPGVSEAHGLAAGGDAPA